MKKILLILMLALASISAYPQITLYAYDKSFAQGDTVSLDIITTGFDSITGCQWCFQFEGLQFVEYLPTFGFNPDFGYWSFGQGCAPLAMSSAFGSSFPDHTILYSIKFVALTDGSLSECIDLQQYPTPGGFFLPASAYRFPLSPVSVAFSFVSPLSSIAPATTMPFAMSATPNPCRTYTTIEFVATGETEYTCIVASCAGSIIQSITGTTAPGSNEMPITLPAPGMYMVAIKTKCHTFTEKVVAQ